MRRTPRSTLFPYTTLFRSFDKQTEQTTVAFQRQVFDDPGKWDGVIGPDTWARLDLLTGNRSEEHTSELQSLRHLVCRLLLEKKKKNNNHNIDAQRPQYTSI